MKRYVCLGNLGDIIAVQDGFEFLRRLFQIPDSLFVYPVAGQLYRQLFQGPSYFQDISQVLLRDFCNFGTLARDHQYKAFQLQLTDCLTDRCTAYAQLIRKLNLHQTLSRL